MTWDCWTNGNCGTCGPRSAATTSRSQDFLQTLVRREFLTNYQVERLVKGERTGFFFGDYRVLYLVGSGTFRPGVSRRASANRARSWPLKVLRNRFSENRAQASLFVREGRVGCTLRHPNIVPIYEVVSEGKNATSW